jgi:hypothetical protein
MFPPLSFFRKGRASVLLIPVFFVLCLCLGAGLFTGCSSPAGNPPEDFPSLYVPSNSVKRVWRINDADPDWYIAITNDTYTEYMPSMLDGSTDINGDNINTGKDTIMYSGTIVETTTISDSSGFIYIKVDDDYELSGPDGYIAVRWENYTGTGIKLWSTFLDGEVKTSLNDAKTAYDVSYDSNWQQLASFTKVNVQVPLKGDLTDPMEAVEITDITYTDMYDMGGSKFIIYSGIIVGTTDPSKSEGYIYIKYATTANFQGGSIAGNYYAIHWRNHGASSIELSGSSDGAGLPTLEAARMEYTVSNAYFSYYTTFSK